MSFSADTKNEKCVLQAVSSSTRNILDSHLLGLPNLLPGLSSFLQNGLHAPGRSVFVSACGIICGFVQERGKTLLLCQGFRTGDQLFADVVAHHQKELARATF